MSSLAPVLPLTPLFPSQYGWNVTDPYSGLQVSTWNRLVLPSASTCSGGYYALDSSPLFSPSLPEKKLLTGCSRS